MIYRPIVNISLKVCATQNCFMLQVMEEHIFFIQDVTVLTGRELVCDKKKLILFVIYLLPILKPKVQLQIEHK